WIGPVGEGSQRLGELRIATAGGQPLLGKHRVATVRHGADCLDLDFGVGGGHVPFQEIVDGGLTAPMRDHPRGVQGSAWTEPALKYRLPHRCVCFAAHAFDPELGVDSLGIAHRIEESEVLFESVIDMPIVNGNRSRPADGGYAVNAPATSLWL